MGKDVEINARSLSIQQNFCFKRDVDVSTAICHACKEKNYTRQYCREKLKHRQLPWPSAYARLSASTKEIAESKRVKKNKATKVSKKAKKDNDELEKAKDEKSEDKSDQAIRDKRENDSGTDDFQSKETPVKKVKTEEGKEEDFSGEEDDTMFEQIPEPSTFLAIVSSKGCTYEWLVVDHSNPNPHRLVIKVNHALVPTLINSRVKLLIILVQLLEGIIVQPLNTEILLFIRNNMVLTRPVRYHSRIIQVIN